MVPAEYNSILADGYYDQNTKYENAGYIVNIKTDEGYRYGYINSKGKQILDTIYTNIKRITEIKTSETVYLTTYKNGKAGIIKNGQTIIENEYENIEYDGELEFEAEALEVIVNKAIERNTGARGLRSIIEDIMRDIMFDIPSNPNIEKCIITKETVESGAKPTLVINELKQEKKATVRKKKVVTDNKETA